MSKQGYYIILAVIIAAGYGVYKFHNFYNNYKKIGYDPALSINPKTFTPRKIRNTKSLDIGWATVNVPIESLYAFRKEEFNSGIGLRTDKKNLLVIFGNPMAHDPDGILKKVDIHSISEMYKLGLAQQQVGLRELFKLDQQSRVRTLALMRWKSTALSNAKAVYRYDRGDYSFCIIHGKMLNSVNVWKKDGTFFQGTLIHATHPNSDPWINAIVNTFEFKDGITAGSDFEGIVSQLQYPNMEYNN